MDSSQRHTDREELAAAIKGLSLEEHLAQKSSVRTRDPADEFAAWHERFRHELESEFGEIPDEDDGLALKEYIKKMRKQFKLRLR